MEAAPQVGSRREGSADRLVSESGLQRATTSFTLGGTGEPGTNRQR